MKIVSQPATALSEQVWSAWSKLQSDNPTLDSPYFSPQFTRAVAAVRSDVEVATLYEQGELVGCFPYQRVRGHGRPVGGRLSDYQGVVSKPDLRICPRSLLRSCGLSVWDFDHLLTTQSGFREYHQLTDSSPYLDLRCGFEAYLAALRPSARSEQKQSMRKGRKLAREQGPLRLELHCSDPLVLSKLIDWKRAQYQRTGVTDVLRYAWTRQLLEEILQTQSDDFAGCLTALYAGDSLAAVHAGMRYRGTLHWWFPTFNPQLAAYSPGRVLLVELARSAEEHRLEKIDLGRGMVPYKLRAMSGVTTVAQGSIDLRPFSRMARSAWRGLREHLRRSPLRAPLTAPAKALHALSEWFAFR